MSLDLHALLGGVLTPSAIIQDPVELEFYAQDVYADGAPLAAVLRPPNAEALIACVTRLYAAEVPMMARGGGLSYTGGYLASAPGPVLIDTSALNRIVELNLEDRYVTVECGLSWSALDAALAAHGLRTPYWGPLSGRHATVGGALAQGSMFLGSGVHGSVGDSVLGLEVVIADGRVLRTGSQAVAGCNPHLRYDGPDASGLFVGDAGTLGIKLRATLRLIPRPARIGQASFQCASAPELFAAMSEISRQRLASECFGFDPVLAQMRLKRASLLDDAATLRRVARSAGWLSAVRLVGAGRRFLDPNRYSLHVVVEGDDRAEVQRRLRAVRAAVGTRAEPIEDSIPKVLRADPFPAPNSILGPAGERWVPVHGLLPHSRAAAAWNELHSVYQASAEARARHDIRIGHLYATLAQHSLLIEPVFYWPDAHAEYHRRVVDAALLARWPKPQAQPAARAEVDRLRHAVVQALRRHGAAHFQLGKFYPYRADRDPAALALYDAVKRSVDPGGLFNPGALR